MLSMEPYGLRGVTRQKDQFEALDADLKQLRKTFHKNGQWTSWLTCPQPKLVEKVKHCELRSKNWLLIFSS